MKCPKCHAENPDTVKFCGECGTQITPRDEAAPSITKTMETPREELTTGSTFAGRYQIIEELGKGGMGSVYRALDKELNEEVALKFIKPEIAHDKKTVERFKTEIRLARRISHKSVGRVHELMEEKGLRFITMEYVPGEDLKSFLRRSGQLTVGKAVSIAKQICEGLAEAHGLGVIHRDLKPNNIMIDRVGNAKIMDFGIARAVKGRGITEPGVMIGTPQYMSPEQVEGKEADQRSDLYSLGIILYEMLAGRVPFEGETPLTVGVKQKTETPEDPKNLNSRIPERLNRLILKCLEKEKENRFPTSQELVSELERFEEGLPTTERVEPEKKSFTSKEITVTFAWRKLLFPMVAVMVLAAVFMFILMNRGPDVDSGRAVVALFENRTGDANLDNLGKLASDWITHGLAQTGDLSTIPTPTVAAITEAITQDDLISGLARETKARWVITGSFYLQEGRLQVHSRINDLEDDKNSASLDPVSGSLENPMEVIESVRQKVMGTMAFKTSSKVAGFLSQSVGTPKYAAYQAFMEGGELFQIKRDYKAAIELFTKALEIDPTFTLPLISMAIGYSNLGMYEEYLATLEKANRYRNDFAPSDRYFLDYLRANQRGDRAEALRLVREAAIGNPLYVYHKGLAATRQNYPEEGVEAFLSIDPELPLWQGWYSYWGDLCDCYHMLGEHKKELKAARQGRKQYPELLSNLWYEVRALAALGKMKEIQQRIGESYNFPSQGSWTPASIMRYASRELRLSGYHDWAKEMADQAIAWYREREERDFRSSVALTLQITDRWEEARAIYEELLLENPGSITYKGYLGVAAARLGERDEALRISNELAEIDRPDLFGNNTYWRACIASVLGEMETAVKLLRDALQQGQSYYRLYFDLDLMPLYDYPPFKELIKPKG